MRGLILHCWLNLSFDDTISLKIWDEAKRNLTKKPDQHTPLQALGEMGFHKQAYCSFCMSEKVPMLLWAWKKAQGGEVHTAMEWRACSLKAGS